MSYDILCIRLRAIFLFLASGFWLLGSLPAPAIVDENANGLSDLWERQCNGGVLYPENFDPQADPDADGWTNAQEAAAGTDPNNPNPPDGILRPDILHDRRVAIDPDHPENGAVETDMVHVSRPTLIGKQYTLFASTELPSNSWLPVGDPLIGTGSIVTRPFPHGYIFEFTLPLFEGDVEVTMAQEPTALMDGCNPPKERYRFILSETSTKVTPVGATLQAGWRRRIPPMVARSFSIPTR